MIDENSADTNETQSKDATKTKAKSVDITPARDGGVLKTILTPGTGDDRPLKGDTVYLHFVGRLEDGTQFDSSRENSQKHQFILDSETELSTKAWQLGIPTMKRGEIAEFHCQSTYAHGKKGLPPKIPPNTSVVYEIELFSWRGEDVSENKDGGVLKSRTKNGHGVNPPKDGAVCNVRLIGRHNDRQFLDRNTKFTLGEGCDINIVDGVEQGLRSMKAGERSLLKVKARYAYGPEGHKIHRVPPDADVEFDVDLESYEPFKESWMLDDEERMSAAATALHTGNKRFQEGKHKFAARKYSYVVDILVEEDTLRGEERRKRDKMMLSAYLNMAASYLKLGYNLDAAHSCDKALTMQPGCEKALYRRANAYMSMSDFESALKDFKTLLKLNPSNKYADEQTVVARQGMKDLEQREKAMYSMIFDKKTKESKASKEDHQQDARDDEESEFSN